MSIRGKGFTGVAREDSVFFQGADFRDFGPCGDHFRNCPFGVAGIEVDTTNGVFKQCYRKTIGKRVENRRPDAVIGGDAADMKSSDAFLSEKLVQHEPIIGYGLRSGI